jgi:PIN domain nuclease of toxin-antitoxin system
MVVVEFGYPPDTNRIVLTPQQIVYKLGSELKSAICYYPLQIIAEIAIEETWTRGPFDRLIVSHAKVNGRAALVTKDEFIAEHYSNTIW